MEWKVYRNTETRFLFENNIKNSEIKRITYHTINVPNAKLVASNIKSYSHFHVFIPSGKSDHKNMNVSNSLILVKIQNREYKFRLDSWALCAAASYR